MAERTRLTAELQAQLLLEIAHKARGSLDLDEILYRLLESLRTVVEHDAAGIFILNQGTGLPHSGLGRNLIAGVAQYGYGQIPPDEDPMLREGKGIIGHVIRTGEVVVAPDVLQDSRYFVGRKESRSEIAVPILQDGRPIGALNIESDRLAAYGPEDLEVLEFFAQAAAIPIERAMLHRQILEKRRIEEQMRIAGDVQARLLPSGPPEIPGHAVSGLCIPTFEIGGDYFDFLGLPGGRLGLALADVSGKGIPAALIMATFRALVRAFVTQAPEPERLAPALNQSLRESTRASAFVTAVYGTLDPGEGRFEYVVCGHNLPLHVQADGGTSPLLTSGPFLGVLEEAGFQPHALLLAPGDLLVLYTDGVVECAEEAGGEEFGVQRLAETLARSRYLPPAEVIEAVVAATREFSGRKDYRDDFTMVVLKRDPAPERAGAHPA